MVVGQSAAVGTHDPSAHFTLSDLHVLTWFWQLNGVVAQLPSGQRTLLPASTRECQTAQTRDCGLHSPYTAACDRRTVFSARSARAIGAAVRARGTRACDMGCAALAGKRTRNAILTPDERTFHHTASYNNDTTYRPRPGGQATGRGQSSVERRHGCCDDVSELGHRSGACGGQVGL